MSTLDKLRALHEEVCIAWYRFNGPAISDGEAEIISLGFMLLERYVSEHIKTVIGMDVLTGEADKLQAMYLNRVHSQFYSDADIKITEI